MLQTAVEATLDGRERRQLQNHPRKNYEEPEPGGRPVSTALVFTSI